MRFTKLLIAAALLTATIAAPAFAQAPAPAREKLLMETSKGPVVIELRPDLAPKHVARIKQLTEQRFYNGLKFHRVIEGFMAQTGDPKGNGTGGSGTKIPAEISNARFVRGTVGMARSQSFDSADSQFFICFKDCSFLNGQYTIWGEVMQGMENVDKLTRGEPPRTPDTIVKMTVAK
jgi:cyclophilin family peptidyl-prolyl cis-trans isomerase